MFDLSCLSDRFGLVADLVHRHNFIHSVAKLYRFYYVMLPLGLLINLAANLE